MSITLPAGIAGTAAQTVRLADYVALAGAAEIEALHSLAAKLSGRTVQMVNSTAVGGGVAEMLIRIVPLMQELQIATRWDILPGRDDFFAVTKAFHNALHGAPYQPRPEDFQIYLRNNQAAAESMRFDCDFTVIHDPQPAALIQARPGKDKTGHWVWRCHIDLSHPNAEVWNFLLPFVSQYDCALFSSPQFTRQLPIAQYLFYPCIDPFSEKNRELEPEYVRLVLERFGIDAARPILTQVSRFDRLKDPLGVLRAYQLVRKFHDCQLVLAGGSAADDPEGEEVFQEITAAAGNDPDVHILNLPPTSGLEINALQTASTVIIQKSLREGFGLTVTEALWKRKPLVASAVGGIPSQVIHQQTGLLTHSIEGAAYHIRFLLSNPAFAQRLGEQGREHVRQNFLITGNVKRYLTVFLHLSSTRRA
jgi:trehalose synthase